MSTPRPQPCSVPELRPFNALVDLFEYKRWANDELLALAITSRERVPEDAFRSFVRILHHTYVVDRIFACHLLGLAQTTYTSTNTEHTPTVQMLRERIAVTDDWYRQYVATLDERVLTQKLAFRFTDGDTGTMTRREILYHLVMHGTYHRGAAGRILATHGLQAPRDSLAVFLHQTDPTRRW